MATRTWAYIAAFRRRDFLFGVTRNLPAAALGLVDRVVEGRQGVAGLYTIVFAELHDTLQEADHALGRLQRLKKKALQRRIGSMNPTWELVAEARPPTLAGDFGDDESSGGVCARIPRNPTHPPRACPEAHAIPDSRSDAGSVVTCRELL